MYIDVINENKIAGLNSFSGVFKAAAVYFYPFFSSAVCVCFVIMFFSGVFCPVLAASDSEKKVPAADSGRRYEASGFVENVSAPTNPRETLMTLDCGDSTSIELILAPATRFYPPDYYPCAGDKIKVNYVVLGVFKKYVIAYSVSLIEEFSGITKDDNRGIKK